MDINESFTVAEESLEKRHSDPDILFHIACSFIVRNFHIHNELSEVIPLHIVVKLIETANEYGLVDFLKMQLSNLNLLLKIMKHSHYRNMLHKCFQMVRKQDFNFPKFLACKKKDQYNNINLDIQNIKQCEVFKFYNDSILLGDFLQESGFYECGCILYQNHSVDLNGNIEPRLLPITFEMTLRLAHCLTLDSKFDEANKVIYNSSLLLNYLQNSHSKPNCALFYTTCSLYLFSLSQYDKAHNLSRQAVLELNKKLSPKLIEDLQYIVIVFISSKIIVDTLRQACKTCIIKRIFHQAHVYIKQATQLTKYWFGTNNAKYADCLSDYGFYLLSIDSVSSSVNFYKKALHIRCELFGDDNVVTAVTHEDLAYATYVRDYSHGGFTEARLHAEQALKTLSELLTDSHLLLASSKRVLALILEEVAIDSNNTTKEIELLQSAELLHLDSLRLAQKTFGEDNVQTAKHYGNLGRLYQSMKKYKQAESNHMKAIKIKEKLLGKEDYEVASSIGHLASLYNYDMRKYDSAEQMYLKSISIGRKLFGVWYSGLEYDYRGLIHLYNQTGSFDQVYEYQTLLVDWKLARDHLTSQNNKDVEIYDEHDDEMSIDEILNQAKTISSTSLKNS